MSHPVASSWFYDYNWILDWGCVQSVSLGQKFKSVSTIKMWVFCWEVNCFRLIWLTPRQRSKVQSICLFPNISFRQIPRLSGVQVWNCKGCLYLKATFDISIPPPSKIKKQEKSCLVHLEGWLVLQTWSLLWPAEIKGFAQN